MVKPIALPKSESIPEGQSTLSGWGSTSTSNNPVMPNTLQKAELPVIDLKTCLKAIKEIESGDVPLHETNVCTGPLDGGYSACSVSIISKKMFYIFLHISIILHVLIYNFREILVVH